MRLGIVGAGKMGREIESAARGRGHDVVWTLGSKENAGGSGLTPERLSAADVVGGFTTPAAAAGNLLALAARGGRGGRGGDRRERDGAGALRHERSRRYDSRDAPSRVRVAGRRGRDHSPCPGPRGLREGRCLGRRAAGRADGRVGVRGFPEGGPVKASAARVDWKGCGTALITPFDEKGRIDFGALERFVNWQIERGIDFLVPCGTTGESATLSGDERKAVTAAVVRVANGRVPVIAGAGGNHTAKAVFWSRDAAEVGADGILSVSPMYNKPGPEGLFRHYSALAEATDLPILVYNVPGRTGSDLDVETILRLAELPAILG